LACWLLGDAGRGRPGGAAAGGDAVGQVGGVVVDEAEQGRPAGVLPGQAQEVQAGHPGDAAPVINMAFTDHAGDVDPGVVRAVAGRPDDHPNVLQEAVVGEADRAALGVDQPRPVGPWLPRSVVPAAGANTAWLM
jgi:hypothetical protein